MSHAIESTLEGGSVDLPSDDGYRAVSTLAVASLVFGLLSVLALLDVVLVLLPAFGILLGSRALQRIRACPEELTGLGLARAGISLSLVLLVAGLAKSAYVYATEVPDGYQRISYRELQAGSDGTFATIPASAEELDGKKVFIKGYVYPGSQSTGITEFVLVRDNGSCCFGGPTPKLHDMIQVKLVKPLELTYSTRLHRLAGTFRVNQKPNQASDDLGAVIYYLEADYLK